MAMQKELYSVRLIRSFRTRGLIGFFEQAWIRFWMRFAGAGPVGRIATKLVTWFAPPHYARMELRYWNPKGFIAPSATLYGSDIRLGPNVFIDDGTVLFQGDDGGPIEIGAGVIICRGTIIETSKGGSVVLGKKTSILPHGFLSAAQASIRIGSGVGVGPYCAFYPHDHGTLEGQDISGQALAIKGDICVEDGVWLGHGVTVLSGVNIGKGAVIGAGSTVAGDVPDGAIAWGVPAKVFMKRKKPIEPPPLGDEVAHSEAGTRKDRL